MLRVLKALSFISLNNPCPEPVDKAYAITITDTTIFREKSGMAKSCFTTRPSSISDAIIWLNPRTKAPSILSTKRREFCL